MRVVIALLVSSSFFPNVSRADNSSVRHDAAKAQFDRAEEQRLALAARRENSRSLQDYIAVVTAYRRVSLITPRAIEVPAALNQVAALYRSMGDLFDEKYYQSAVDSYQFLLREYPTNRYREDAMLAIAQIEQEDLHDTVLAQKSYEEFLALHPHSLKAEEVRATLDKINNSINNSAQAEKSAVQRPVVKDADRSPVKTTIADKTLATAPATDTMQGSSQRTPGDDVAAGGSGPQVTRIRTWNADTYTRIVIDVGAQVKYQAARISGPDRIFFDIEGAKISPAFLHKPVEVEAGGFLKAVRVAQNQSGVVRVVLEVNHVKDYSVFLLPDPYRLIVDVYGSSAALEDAALAPEPASAPTQDLPSAKLKKQDPESAANIPSNPVSISPSKDHAKFPVKSVAKSNPIPASEGGVAQADKIEAPPAFSAVRPMIGAGPFSPPVARPTPANKAFHPVKSAHDQAEELGPPSIPQPTRSGQQSLSRALGLKVGRIVIDAGHGGHDTGTIGPTGLMEKDLCLDVALRLGKLIRQRLPGAEVIFTRDDDTFIPLEQRTAIANEAQADLFLSIHANSSPDQKARGIETYYLNFTGSSDALQVAARENSLAENSVHDLQDIVKKIAQNEKIEESRDFASSIQDSLAKHMDNLSRGERNRGVRKAPFVVLIGANMPSVLAEISFISNPSDEQSLKKPENRQRVAEGLYHGIESYLHSTNSLTVDLGRSEPGNRPGIVARNGNPQ